MSAALRALRKFNSAAAADLCTALIGIVFLAALLAGVLG